MKIKSLFISLIALMAVMSVSCSKESPVIESIPADAQFVAKIDGKKALEALKIKVENSEIVLPDYIKSDGGDTEKLAAISKLYNCIDPENIFAFGAKANTLSVLLTGEITDLPTFEALFSDVEKVDGYSVGKMKEENTGSVIWNGSQFWIANSGSAARQVETIKAVLKAASDKSMADVPAVADAFKSNSLATLAFNSFNLEKEGKKQSVWSISNFSTKGSALEIDSKSLTADGADYSIEGMTDINSSALQYLPSNVVFATAFGLSDKFDWKTIFDAISNSGALNPTETAQLGMILPFLEAVDGSVVVGVGLASGVDFNSAVSGQFNPADWRFIAMVHMNQTTSDQLIKMAQEASPQIGINLTQVENGLFSANYEGVDIYFGMVDGYLTLANYKPEPVSGSALAGKFSGHQVAAAFDIPSFSFASPKMAYGLSLTDEGSGNKGKCVVTLTNTTEDFFPTLISAAN